MTWTDASPEIQGSVLAFVREHYIPGKGSRTKAVRLLPFELRGVAYHAITILDLEALESKYGPKKEQP